MDICKEILTSRQNSLVKWASSLAETKERKKNRAFLAEGEKLTFEAADARLPVTHVFVKESKATLLLAKICEAFSDSVYDSTRLIRVSDDVFEKISTEKSPQGVISVIKYLDFFKELDIIYKDDFYFLPEERVLALYSVRDPGNLGSVIRSAVAFGITHIVLSADCADLYHPRTVRGAMGSFFRVKTTVVSDFPSFIANAQAHGRRVLAAELSDGAVPLSEIGLSASDIIVIGNEGHGIAGEVSAACNASVYIPISEKTESLNAAVAAGVFMWEQKRACEL